MGKLFQIKRVSLSILLGVSGSLSGLRKERRERSRSRRRRWKERRRRRGGGLLM